MAPALGFATPAAAGTSLFTPSAKPGVGATCRSPAALPVAPPRMAAGGVPDAAARVAAVAAAAVFAASALTGPPPPAAALTSADIRSLTYEQVKGTGLANRCPEVDVSKGSIPLSSNKSYKLVDLCLEPKTFQVEEEVGKKGESRKAFVDTKLMTRATYTLSGIEGTLRSEGDKLVFEEKEGIDYAATTVQLPGGERLPFLFTIKQLVATAAGGGSISTATEFGGSYRVPSYRTGGFLDPVRWERDMGEVREGEVRDMLQGRASASDMTCGETVSRGEAAHPAGA